MEPRHAVVDDGHSRRARRRTIRAAVARVTYEMLEDLLHLPSGEVKKVGDSDRAGEFDVLVESPDFEPVTIGLSFPVRTIMYDTKDGRIIKSRWSW